MEITHPVVLNVSFKLFSTKTMFYAHTTCLKIPCRSTEWKNIYIWSELPYKCWKHLAVFVNVLNFFQKKTYPLLPSLQHPSLFLNLYQGECSERSNSECSHSYYLREKVVISQILCFIMHFYKILLFNH